MSDVSRLLDKSVKPPPPPASQPPSWWGRLGAQEDLNFLLTNRIPRHAATLTMGWISRIRSPLFTRLALAVWQRFTPLDLSEATQTTFQSIHEVFTRAIKPEARPIDPDAQAVCSPCDAIVGASGRIEGDTVLQAKGMPYRLSELVGPTVDLAPFTDGHYVTLRLTSGMYHRFHSPDALHLEHVTYISGDTWNVNPVAVKRIERLYCRNERAVLRTRLHDGTPMLIVPVAAILVASLRLHALDVRLHLKYRGPNEIPADLNYARGEEIGWFEHGSTIIVITPSALPPDQERVAPGHRISMGQALWRRPRSD